MYKKESSYACAYCNYGLSWQKEATFSYKKRAKLILKFKECKELREKSWRALAKWGRKEKRKKEPMFHGCNHLRLVMKSLFLKLVFAAAIWMHGFSSDFSSLLFLFGLVLSFVLRKLWCSPLAGFLEVLLHPCCCFLTGLVCAVEFLYFYLCLSFVLRFC